MTNKNEPALAQPTWISVVRRVPKDGQSVLAKGRFDLTPRRVTFVARPTPRWEEGNVVYQFERFDHWALPPS